MKAETLDFYAVYDRPTDYPNAIVVRRYQLSADGSVSADSELFGTYGSVGDARQILHGMGLIPNLRYPDDDPKMIESWF